MKTKLLILGCTGMLGSAVAKHFLRNSNYDVTMTYRNRDVVLPGNSIAFDAIANSLDDLPTDFDYVINCIGVIKPFMAQDIIAAIKINSLFPWQLAKWCEKSGIKLIHITTDCVFSGKDGKYVENSLHDALDDYGKSKSLGECTSKAMVLRTSIIGEEIHKNASLIAWAKSQKGKSVKGFKTHLWNGVSTNQYAKICDQIITEGLYETGLFHVHAQDDVSKLQMMQYFDKYFDLGLTIEEAAPAPVDRTLRTDKPLNAKLNVPRVEQMIREIALGE